MDISTFRWILIVLGVAIIAGIFLLGNPEKKPKRRAVRRENRRAKNRPRKEPTLEDRAGRAEAGTEATVQPDLEPTAGTGATAPIPDKIVTLYLRARDNHRIAGVDLLDAALKSGMVFGNQDIFHRQLEGDPRPVFSMADLTNPGTFDRQAWNTFETKGVTLFMTLPGPLSALDAWDAMLGTSRRLAARS